MAIIGTMEINKNIFFCNFVDFIIFIKRQLTLKSVFSIFCFYQFVYFVISRSTQNRYRMHFKSVVIVFVVTGIGFMRIQGQVHNIKQKTLFHT